MAEPLTPETPDDDLSADTSRLDAGLLRYVLLLGSRMNMLALDRKLQALRDTNGLLRLQPGLTRSDLAYRAAATMQLAVELALADPAVVDWVRDDPLRRQMAIDAAYYPSDCWEAAHALPPAPGAAPAAIATLAADAALKAAAAPSRDEAEAARKGFGDYMAKHTRLHEDAKHQSERDGAAAARGPSLASSASSVPSEGARQVAPLLPQLESIALAVLDMLSPGKAPEAWRTVARARQSHPGFAAPPPELFDALLAAPGSLIIARNGMAAKWRCRPDGSLLEPLDNHAADLLMVDRIEAARQLLAQHLAAGEATSTFTLLADHLGVLPTTPAWPDVKRALVNVKVRLELEVEPTSDAQASAADQMVSDFDALLSRHAGTVVRVLACARFFVSVAQHAHYGEPTLSLRHGLEWLREALCLPESDPGLIEEKLGELERQLRDRLKHAPGVVFACPWQADASIGPVKLASLPDALQRAEMLAKDYREHLLSNNEATAWADARKRLAVFCNQGRVGNASLAELLCASTHQGPARWLKLDPRRMTLRLWNNALLAATVGRHAEPWLAAIALQRLGAGNLRPAQQEQLLAALQPASSPAAPSPVSRAALAEVVHQLGAWRGSGRGVGSVIVVCKRHSPATALWTKPPRLGLALIATPAELNQLVQHKPALLRALPKPLRIDVERPVDEGVLLSMTLAELDSVANERPWYRRVGQILAALLGLAPASNDLQRPAGPDALLAAHLGGSNR